MNRRVAALVGLIGVLGIATALWVPIANGDGAVYVAQAAAGDPWSRAIHVGYLAPAAVLGGLGVMAVARILGVVSAIAVAVAVGMVARRDERGALLVAGVLLPLSGFVEVDAVWFSAVAMASVLPRNTSIITLSFAILVSPTALLAVPWLLILRKDDRWALGAAAAATVLVVTLATHGGWWVGDRGVLHTPLSLGKSVVHGLGMALPAGLALLWAPPARRWAVAAALPVLLAPADVPAWVVLVLAASFSVEGMPLPRWGRIAVVGGGLILGLGRWGGVVVTAKSEETQIRAVLAGWKPSTRLIAPWGWGVRASVWATGAPYALAWRTPNGTGPTPTGWCDSGTTVVALPHHLSLPTPLPGCQTTR